MAFFDKAKNGLILLLVGGIAGAGLVLWLTRRRKQETTLPRPAVPAISGPPPRPRSRPAPGAEQYESPDLDNEIEDADIDFEGGSEF